jgi:hypothetical protein
VRQRHPDLLAVVLEREDLLDALDRGQLRRPLGPHVDDEAGTLGAELGEHAVVVAGEADDLAPAEPGTQLCQRRPRGGGRHVLRDGGGQGREAVLEDDDLVVGFRDLGLPAGSRRAQRALVGRREEGAGLPVGGDHDPLPQQRVVPHLGERADRREVPRIDGVARGRLGVEVEDLASVGEASAGADHGRDASGGTTRAPDRGSGALGIA